MWNLPAEEMFPNGCLDSAISMARHMRYDARRIPKLYPGGLTYTTNLYNPAKNLTFSFYQIENFAPYRAIHQNPPPLPPPTGPINPYRSHYFIPESDTDSDDELSPEEQDARFVYRPPSSNQLTPWAARASSEDDDEEVQTGPNWAFSAKNPKGFVIEPLSIYQNPTTGRRSHEPETRIDEPALKTPKLELKTEIKSETI